MSLLMRLHRLSHRLHGRGLMRPSRLVDRVIFALFNSDVPGSCVIGEGSYVTHGGIGVVLHGRSVIGARVSIGQGVTVGGSFGSDVPVIGDDVWIGPGARVLGAVHVGSNVIIGANAVVVRDVPPNSVVGGVPARVIRAIPPGALDTATGTLRLPAGAAASDARR